MIIRLHLHKIARSHFSCVFAYFLQTPRMNENTKTTIQMNVIQIISHFSHRYKSHRSEVNRNKKWTDAQSKCKRETNYVHQSCESYLVAFDDDDCSMFTAKNQQRHNHRPSHNIMYYIFSCFYFILCINNGKWMNCNKTWIEIPHDTSLYTRIRASKIFKWCFGVVGVVAVFVFVIIKS